MSDNKYENIEGTASWLVSQIFTDDKKSIFNDDIYKWQYDNYLRTVARFKSYDISEGDYVNVCTFINKQMNYKGIVKTKHTNGVLLQQKKREFLISCHNIEDIQIIRRNVVKNVIDLRQYKATRRLI